MWHCRVHETAVCFPQSTLVSSNHEHNCTKPWPCVYCHHGGNARQTSACIHLNPNHDAFLHLTGSALSPNQTLTPVLSQRLVDVSQQHASGCRWSETGWRGHFTPKSFQYDGIRKSTVTHTDCRVVAAAANQKVDLNGKMMVATGRFLYLNRMQKLAAECIILLKTRMLSALLQI